jgi:hypothetical protein
VVIREKGKLVGDLEHIKQSMIQKKNTEEYILSNKNIKRQNNFNSAPEYALK